MKTSSCQSQVFFSNIWSHANFWPVILKNWSHVVPFSQFTDSFYSGEWGRGSRGRGIPACIYIFLLGAEVFFLRFLGFSVNREKGTTWDQFLTITGQKFAWDQIFEKMFEGKHLVLATWGFHIPILLFWDASNGRGKKNVSSFLKNDLTYRISSLSRVNKKSVENHKQRISIFRNINQYIVIRCLTLNFIVSSSNRITTKIWIYIYQFTYTLLVVFGTFLLLTRARLEIL